ncbi:hypothetical protein A1O3_02463 [Capronia epimyces CBS 606.96]|uniref:AB hydrolase-1 domain-containing protein n=1 Tax=Capronia epimyces CBS 606.96 TaxID=1182542 RepID=W9YJI8_9EURO|nr:uncharacterized protein A1O3_02463 [Capronia epimyces CBS 606.96]EXJ89396.1 hypothetical protein A1O3_02463 [Capronia epimyces CBS 606.96]
MLQLSSDPTFHYELLRVLAAAATQGSDVSELLQVCPDIIPGDFPSWYVGFDKLAKTVLQGISSADKHYDNVSLRNAYFRASHYFFAADFFLHGNPDDPRIDELHQQWTTLFDKAIALLPVPGERRSIQADGFEVPVILLRPDTSAQQRPTIILGNGFDGAMEEMMHVLGFPALERGYNVVLYEGPGQTGIRRTQDIGFIHDWERVVGPVVDHLLGLDFVDPRKISLLGYSLGGYFAARAAAFEPRLAACILIDGVWDYSITLAATFPRTWKCFQAGDVAGCNSTFEDEGAHGNTMQRWASEHFLWSFNKTAYEGLQEAQKMKVEDIIHNIQCPVFVGTALEDQFAALQPGKVAQALGKQAYSFAPGNEYAATAHCHMGATFYMAQEIFAWLHDKHLHH